MMKHGGDIYTFIEEQKALPIDFSANINPLGMPEAVKETLKNSVELFSPYPDVLCRKLVKALSHFEKVAQDNLVIGNGAADIIFRTVYSQKPKKALVLAPTFSEYEDALKNVSCEIEYYYLKEENNFEMQEDILDMVSCMDMIFICNPNNPTGILTKVEIIEKIIRKTKALVVIDECFMDFVKNQKGFSFKPYLNEFENLLILGAFTKIFAMAGLRLGYGITKNKVLLEEIKKAGQPWSVSTPAQIAGEIACKEIKFIEKTIDFVEQERKFLIKGLSDLGYKVFSGSANYIFFKAHKDLYNYLLSHNIIIRSCKNYVGLNDTYFRIAVKNHKDNTILLEALKNGKGYNDTRHNF